ncbi:Deoxyuridine 5'-triphosphate nucleotidohydrolase [Candidatus Gugararchaeum adminiculabundum]|nr:Deoxyuridine 5'-triphosphate nucleotidohydrolase [Candidatus Gugararchaeum adminiculabundum]
MILPKHTIVSNSLVKETINDSQFQPCGVDLTLKEAHEFTDAGKIDFDNKERKLSGTKKIEFDANGEVKLAQGCYKVIYNEYVEIPDHSAALAFTRSSLLRCGASIECAVWDPGYHGRSESLLIVHNKHGLVLKKNAKIVQLIFVKLEEKAKELYSGQYKGENR